MEISTIRKILGHGTAKSDGTTCDVRIEIEFDILGRDKAKCKVECTQPNQEDKLNAFFRGHTREIIAKTDQKTDIWIRQLFPNRLSGSVIEAETFELIQGDLNPFDGKQGNVVCKFSLPSASAVKVMTNGERFWTGEVRTKEKLNEGIRFQTALGAAILTDGVDLIETDIEDIRTTLEWHKSILAVNLLQPDITSFGSLIEKLDEETRDVLWLAAFLEQRPLHWYNLELDYLSNSELVAEHKGATVYQFGHKDSFEEHTPLIEQPKLADGIFQALLDSLINSPMRNELRRAIIFLLGSFDQGLYLESQLVSLYTAIEILAYALGQHHHLYRTMSNSQFETLKKRLLPLLDEILGSDETATKRKQSVIRKLPELERRAIHERLVEFLGGGQVSLQTLWENDTDLEIGLHEILKRRDNLVHQGTEIDKEYSLDKYRLRFVIGHWLLKLLNCPDEALSFRAFQREKAFLSLKRSH